MDKISAVFRRVSAKAVLCLLAFSVSFGYALCYRIRPSVDARRYHTVATNLVTRHAFCEQCDVPLAVDTAIQGVGPGYQFFLAGIYSAFGIRPWAVWLVQAVLHAAVVGWLFDLARRYAAEGERRWFLLPVAVYAVHPDIVQGNAMLMTEGLFTFLLVAFVVAFDRWWRGGRAGTWGPGICFGALGAGMALTRPTGLPIFVALLGFVVWKRAWKPALVAAAVFVLLHVPWAVRNERVLHRFIYNSAVGGADVWVGLHPDSDGTFDLDKLADVRAATEGKAADEIERLSLAEAKKIVVAHPVYAFARTVRKFFGLFGLDKTSGFWFHYRGSVDQAATVLVSVLANAALLTFGFAGLFAALWNRRDWEQPLLPIGAAIILLLAAAPTLTVIANRYRIPMLPFLALFSAYWFGVSRGRRQGLLLAAGFIGVGTATNLALGLGKVTARLRLLFPS